MNKFLLLWIEAPLQSWGVDSKFGHRNTVAFPTKSGILGLLCAAAGASGEQKDLLFQMSSLKQTVISFKNPKKEVTFQLTDFHMIGSGYKNTPWEKLLSPKTLEEKPSNAGPSKITYRDYLQNKKFAVIVEAPLSLLELFSEGLKNPVFSIYFGRKNCVPTDLVFRGIFDNEDQAFETIKVISEEKNLIENFRVIDGNFEGDSLSINDVPITFGTIKQYRERMITIQKKE